jgi:hypothetical protein
VRDVDSHVDVLAIVESICAKLGKGRTDSP